MKRLDKLGRNADLLQDEEMKMITGGDSIQFNVAYGGNGHNACDGDSQGGGDGVGCCYITCGEQRFGVPQPCSCYDGSWLASLCGGSGADCTM